MTDLALSISKQLNLKKSQVLATIELLDTGNTIPFIARYRKEKTESLDEEQLRQIEALCNQIRALDERRAAVLASIEEQGKLTPELAQQINAATNLTQLEDLYQPYKPKRRTRATIAKEKGLQGLADLILAQKSEKDTLEKLVKPYLSEQVPTQEEALAGACDIVAETISDHPAIRQAVRQKAMQWGSIYSDKIEDAKDERQVYELYYEYECRIDRLRPHQVLALNRGEAEKVLRLKLVLAERDWYDVIIGQFRPNSRSPFSPYLDQAIHDSTDRLLLPAIERDVRSSLTEEAEKHAILVFSNNLRGLLSQPPLVNQVVLGLDPGFRTGCKVAVVDATGKLLDTGTIYPHEPMKRWNEALAALGEWVKKYHVTLLAIGNGTASRETEQLAAQLIKAFPALHYVIVSEAGASVYSASPLARAEFPNLDVSLRGAVSIARRIQDPLAELVKIEPKAIGVGLYQHDVNQSRLEQALVGVVESVVNRVGVDLNTASPALLTHISGIGPKLAEKIVAYREEHGVFKNRRALREVSGLGPKAFEQSAGFLRIRDGDESLDSSAIHPESYPVARKLLALAKTSMAHTTEKRKAAVDLLLASHSIEKIAAELDCGLPTLKDILEQIVRPGRDPRQDAPAPILRSDVLKTEDLVEGMVLKGTVRNVVDFGAFVDIGVKHDGLLHRSQLPQGTVLQLGDIVDVEIIKIEAQRGRISLGLAQDIDF
ncbi:MAG TPA: Tex family protein [Anaerolineaceae bacterium]|nr:Tex family protein [Anaerolineaceae bacterium]HPN51713.1 Tex family protein [Anaerolineaceae bacterium]